ncbi:MAG: GNAT family N-acetyltransferase [Christensenella sp.]|uniref:GNAT family N-acetyltransferase n=1 Tax=Christensenella sp. TaxID=1935934 RepID=UPI002B20B8EE|nr:GNAT family N-acetyltransferase [Christensenella sp.]MEA5003946.1 GNAT family N-acetyltransferase [Christensenella sp.]
MANSIFTDVSDERFVYLNRMLDDEYFRQFGEVALRYKKINQIGDALAVLLLTEQEELAGGGCIRFFDENTAEVKRVWVPEPFRRHGYGRRIVTELEQKAKELGYTYMVLETSHMMPWATSLYESLGYSYIPNYGFYENDDLCVCMKKAL